MLKIVARAAGAAVAGLMSFGLLHSAQAQKSPPSEPLIRVEAGIHTAPIKGIGVDRECKVMVTGSDDKTAKIWSVPQSDAAPTLLRTLRPPIDDGDVGKIYTVAMTPDGAIAAVAGWSRHDAFYVMIFDVANGAFITELGPLTSIINRVAFSADGRYLAAGLGNGKGVRAWERQGAAEWREVLKDEDFNGRDSYGVAFGPDGRLYAAGDDGSLRRYSRNFKREAKITTKAGKEPYSIAVHPNGKIVAVGHDDAMAVELYDADTLALQHTGDTKGLPTSKNLSSVTWSPDGQRLWAGGTYSVDSKRQMRVWGDVGRGPPNDYPTGSENTIREVTTCKDWIGYVASDPGFGRMSLSGSSINWIGSGQVDMRNKLADAFTVSPDGLRVRFGLNYGGGDPVIFDAAAGTLVDAANAQPGFLAARIEGLDIVDWKHSRIPLLRGKPIELKQYEESRSLAIAPDARSFVIGANWSLRSFDAQGKEQWNKPTTATTWGVLTTANRKLILAAHGDGTIRWYRGSDGRELLRLFVHAKERRWVAWTPKGYYTASDKGDDLIGWHQNRGWGKVAEFTFAHERRDRFRRPGVIRAVLELADEDKGIEAAGKRQ